MAAKRARVTSFCAPMPKRGKAPPRPPPPPVEGSVPLAWAELVAWLRASHEERHGVQLSTPAAEDRARGVLVSLGFSVGDL